MNKRVDAAKKIITTCSACHKAVDNPTDDRCTKCQGLVIANEEEPSPGLLIEDAYEIIESIGEGSWGKVFRAKQVSLDRDVAIKIMHRRLAADERKVQRFKQEAVALKNLHHPSIASIIDSGVTESGQPYLVQDFIRGQSLRQWLLANRAPSPRELKNIFSPILDALSMAHSQNIVHRDIKPDNIIVNENANGATLLDFGISKFAEEQDRSLTATGELLGTPLYMSPEQCSGDDVDARSDLYSLACVLFQAITGSAPFESDSNFDCMMKHVKEKCPDAKAGPVIQEFLNKALAKNASDRFQTAAEFKQALLSLPDDIERVTSAGTKTGRHSAGISGRLAVPVTMVLVVVVACLFFLSNSTQKPPDVPLPVSPSPLSSLPIGAPAIPNERKPQQVVENEPEQMLMETNAPVTREEELSQSINDIKKGASWLDQHGRKAQANQILDELAKFKQQGTAYNSQPNDGPTIHVVSIGGGRSVNSFSNDSTANIEITYDKKPMILILNITNQYLTCNLKIHPGVRLLRVIICGSQPKTINGLPPGVPNDFDSSGASPVYAKDVWDYPLFKRMVEKFYKTGIATFLDQTDSGQYVVGPPNKSWIASFLNFRLQNLLTKATEGEKAEAEKLAAEAEFTALRHVQQEDKTVSYIARWNGLGPKTSGKLLNLENLQQIIEDPASGKTFAIADYGKLFEVMSNGTTKLVKLPEYLSAVNSAVYNPKTKSFLFDSYDGLFQWNTTTNVWKKISKLYFDGKDGLGLSQDSYLYSFVIPNSSPGQIRTLVKFDLTGKLIEKIKLDHPIWWVDGKAAQLFFYKGYLIAIGGNLQIPGATAPSELRMINTKTGRVLLNTQFDSTK